MDGREEKRERNIKNSKKIDTGWVDGKKLYEYNVWGMKSCGRLKI